MSQEPPAAAQSIPPAALDEAGRMLGPERMPLAALIDPEEGDRLIAKVAESDRRIGAVVSRPQPPGSGPPNGCLGELVIRKAAAFSRFGIHLLKHGGLAWPKRRADHERCG